MSLQVESNRSSGRTTRMILKAAEYLVKHPTKQVTIVGYDHRSLLFLKRHTELVLSDILAERICYITLQQTLSHDIQKENYFFDHHCFYAKRQQLISELEFVNKHYGRWDE
ncbi:hypothetical protein fBA2_026 [Acinetobacter virus fBenAci002]|uniref:Uncharacterized protein n=1 Tax=Acinetobacter virus fBenAci002 TaxID=2781369 RepID=A0A7S6RAF8_9CAUD|nr:hypothetical protein fBA2_026 [Acinetobacter virus fBenAci002]